MGTKNGKLTVLEAGSWNLSFTHRIRIAPAVHILSVPPISPSALVAELPRIVCASSLTHSFRWAFSYWHGLSAVGSFESFLHFSRFSSCCLSTSTATWDGADNTACLSGAGKSDTRPMGDLCPYGNGHVIPLGISSSTRCLCLGHRIDPQILIDRKGKVKTSFGCRCLRVDMLLYQEPQPCTCSTLKGSHSLSALQARSLMAFWSSLLSFSISCKATDRFSTTPGWAALVNSFLCSALSSPSLFLSSLSSICASSALPSQRKAAQASLNPETRMQAGWDGQAAWQSPQVMFLVHTSNLNSGVSAPFIICGEKSCSFRAWVSWSVLNIYFRMRWSMPAKFLFSVDFKGNLGCFAQIEIPVL